MKGLAMKWADFKAEVEKQGLADDDEIEWIDWCPPGDDDFGCVTVFRDQSRSDRVHIFW